MFVDTHVQEGENDSTLEDNSASLGLKVLPRAVKLALSAKSAGISAKDQLVWIALTRSARVTAQVYLAGKPQPIQWRRSLAGGTVVVRIPLPATLAKGQAFTLVLRAKSGTSAATARLRLHYK
jgi:hypothetical protein